MTGYCDGDFGDGPGSDKFDWGAVGWTLTPILFFSLIVFIMLVV